MSTMSRWASTSSGTSSPAQSNDATFQASSSSSSNLGPYHLEPPSWRPRLQESSSSLGVPDFYPPFPGQPEDDMSEPTVRSGISSKPVVGNETFSAHDMIYDRLKSGGITGLLGNLFTEILSRREELNLDSIGTSEYRLPPRVTLNDFKLNFYIKDLADPEVPLHRLSKSVPHGYRGEKMLDMLWGTTSSNQSSTQTKLSAAINAPRPSVEISRAVWFIRVVGASELQSARSRPNTNYTAEWTSVVTGWLRKQLNELTVSPSTISGLNTVQGSYSPQVSSPALSRGPPTPSRRSVQAGSNNFNSSSSRGEANPLLDVETEKRWTSKWSYSLSLVRGLLQQSLMDQKVFLRWTTEMLAIANISQLPFVLAIVQENANVYTASNTLSRSLAESICSKLKELENARETEQFASFLYRESSDLLRDLFRSVPESFISPRLWKNHRKMLESLLGDKESNTNPKRKQSDFEMVKSRVESLLLFDVEISRNRSKCSQARVVNTLDRISPSSDLSLIAEELFQDPKGSVYDQIDLILNWSCCGLRIGTHRPYAAARLLQIIFERGAASRKGKRSGNLAMDPQQILMRWLGEVDSALSSDPQLGMKGNEERVKLLSTLEFPSIVILFGELVRLGIFSFPKYLQRLSARGLTLASDSSATSSTNSSTNPTSSIHTRLLRSIPTYNSSSTVQQQRRAAIYGPRAKESWEEATERRAIRELHSALPWLYSSDAAEKQMEYTSSSSRGITTRDELIPALPHLWSGSRFIRIRVISEQLLPAILARAHLVDSNRLSLAVAIICEVEDFASLAEMVLSFLQLQVDNSTLSLLCSVILQHSLIWTCLGSSNLMSGYLLQLYRLSLSAESSSSESSRILVSTLKGLASHGVLGKEGQDQVSKNRGGAIEVDQHIYNGDINQIVAMLKHLISSPQDLEHTIHSLTQQQSVTVPLTQAVFELALSIEDDSNFDISVLVSLLDWLCIQSTCTLEIGLKRWAQSHFGREGGATPPEIDSQSNRISGILIEMVLKGHLTCQSVIVNLIEPCLSRILGNVVGLARFPSTPPKLLSTSLALVKAILLLQSSTSTPFSLLQEVILGASRSQFLTSQGESPESLARLLVNLCALESTTNQQPEDSSSTQSTTRLNPSDLFSSLSSLREVRGLVLSNFSSFISCSRNSANQLWGTDVQAVLNKVIFSFDQTTLLLQPVLELNSERLLKRLDPWRQRQTISEVDILAERLLSLDPSLSNKGLAKVNEMAETLYRVLFSVHRKSESAEEGSLSKVSIRMDDSLGELLLQTTSSQQLISKLVETSLSEALSSFRSGKGDEMSSMSSLVRIQRFSSVQPLPIQSSESLTQSFLHVCNFFKEFETKELPSTEDSVDAKAARTDSESLLIGHLRFLAFLLNLNLVWNQQCKSLFPQLLCDLFNMGLIFAIQEEDEEIFRWLIDLIAFTQEELPSEIQAHTISAFTSHLESHLHTHSFSTLATFKPSKGGSAPLPASNWIRLRRLGLPSTQNNVFGDLVLSRSMNAVSHSDGVSAPNRPWNLMEPIQPTSNSSQSNLSEGPYISLPIANKTSISLESFSGQVTRDNLPETPCESHQVETMLTCYRHTAIPIPNPNSNSNLNHTQEESKIKMEPSKINNQLPTLDPKIGYRFFESERTYGTWKGGEPFYARDSRRGLIWELDDEVDLKLKEIQEGEERMKQEKENRERKEVEEKKIGQKVDAVTDWSNSKGGAISKTNQSIDSHSNKNVAAEPVGKRPKPRSSSGAKAAQRLKDEEKRRWASLTSTTATDEESQGISGSNPKKRKSRDDDETE